MASRIQRIRHVTATADLFVGLDGELTVDTTRKAVRVHDGTTAGGFEAALADLSNVPAATASAAGSMSASDKSKLDGIATGAQVNTISTVFGRSGAIVATNGDYTAANITNVPAGNISAVTVQAAIDELETEKASLGAVNTFTALQKLAKGANVASGAALTLGNDGNYFVITGTSSVTSIATKGVGTEVTLEFAGALVLTHNATDLILPSGANILTAVGDTATFVEYATGDWRCINYTRADGSALVGTSGTTLPSGSMTMFAGPAANAPTGWFLCDGATIGDAGSGATHASADNETLFDLIKGLYGGTGTESFAGGDTVPLPDLRGRTPIGTNDAGLSNGADGGLSTRNEGDEGGAETHQLSEAEMPSHTHGESTAIGSGSATFSPGSGGTFLITSVSSSSSTTNSTGGDSAHNNMQPFTTINFIIKQ